MLCMLFNRIHRPWLGGLVGWSVCPVHQKVAGLNLVRAHT